MPEGHTIHRLARDHARDLVGKKLRVSSPQGRFDCSDLDGKNLVRIDAYGKHLVYVFGGRSHRYVHVHLGLFGKFFRREGVPPAPRPTTRMRVSTKHVTIDLSGPTACEELSRAELDRLLARIGPDPLRGDADLASAAARLAKKKTPIGAALLDQSVVAGIGNVYRAEILFLHRIHPATPANQISLERHAALLDTTRRLLERGVAYGRIVTVTGAGARAKKDNALYVYKRAACKECGARIDHTTVGGRTCYFCPDCQIR